uniref:TIR domain-containing protein n=1 Tax=Biomphalaria glabrata TaxID=6526 RepID=A0A2C9LIS6_BIOGL
MSLDKSDFFQQNVRLDYLKSSKNDNSILQNLNFSVNSDSMCIEYELTVDCSNLHLKEINSSWFPNNTELIFLNDNILSKLVNSTFKQLIDLIQLDISNNKISHIGLLAFEGLTSLKYLSLANNEIAFDRGLTDVFKPLKNLETLNLIQKLPKQKSNVPADAFSDNKATAHRCMSHVIMNMNPIIGNPFALLAFTFAKNLETIFIVGHQCSYIASDSKDEYLDAIQNVEALDSREFNRYRRKGTWEHNKQLYKDKSSKNMRNVILRDINISINVGSECHVYNLTVDCSKLHLKEINSSWFSNNTEMILLNDNLLTRLVNSTFVHLSHLTHLDLSNNEILLIDLLAFDGLTSLKYLSLRHNSISFDAVSTNILKPLNNLQLLDLIQQPSAGITDVPVSLLQSLTRLRSLAINTFNSTLYFGPEFLNLTHLEVLEITGSTRNVTESSFKNVNGLKELIVRDMPLLKRMDDKVFVHLDKLTSLTLAYVSIDLQRVLALLWPFKGRSMSEIYLQGVTTTLYLPNLMKNGYITKKDLIYITDICLDTFTVIDCNIYYITADAFSNRTTWDRCLRNMYISRNPFIGSSFVFFPLVLLQNLTKLTVSEGIRTCQTFSPFPRLSFMEYFFQDISIHNLSFDGQTKFKNNLANQELSILNGTFYLYVSKSLIIWNLKRLVPGLSLQLDVTFCGADNLQYIDISDSGFHTFTGHIRGLSSVKTAIISGNDISILSEYFLDGIYGLENLAVSKCQLDRNFIALKSARILQNITKLKVLDISNNSLNGLSKGTFSRNSELLYLSLSGNQFKDIPFDYKTDVYIGYSDEDYRFPCVELREHLERNLKLSTFIIDRDLLASLDKASGIVDAINSCWRVLLVCSKSFLMDEDWSMFTL